MAACFHQIECWSLSTAAVKERVKNEGDKLCMDSCASEAALVRVLRASWLRQSKDMLNVSPSIAQWEGSFRCSVTSLD